MTSTTGLKFEESKNRLNPVKNTLDFITDLSVQSDLAYGCIFGAFVGDSLGTYLEFSTKPASKDEMIKCMKMPGGGFFKVGPGQVSDDSEQAMCLLQAIINSNSKVIELNSIAIANFAQEEMANEIQKNSANI
jgi:ADP-ribosylglycohydrolase